MLNYGGAPAADELEFSLFGPGCGEAIALHLGDHKWILIDSCIFPQSKQPATLDYLQKIGVDPESVKVIVASHWHDDHVRGISKLAEECSNAEVYISQIFNCKELQTILHSYSGLSGPFQARGTKELYSIFKHKFDQGKQIRLAQQRQNVFEEVIQGRPIRVDAISPTPNAVTQAMLSFAQYLPNPNDPVSNLPEVKPNFTSIALHIELGDDAILLGSDLEDHAQNGWSCILNDAWVSAKRKASAYKIAHHGSHNGDHDDIWQKLLSDKPHATMTPFSRSGLPRPDDVSRIQGRTEKAFITSRRSKKPEMDSGIAKRLGSMCNGLAKIDSGFGAVRLRRKIDNPTWSVELFGDAEKL